MQRVAFRIYGIMKFQLTNYLELTNNNVGPKIGGRALLFFQERKYGMYRTSPSCIFFCTMIKKC